MRALLLAAWALLVCPPLLLLLAALLRQLPTLKLVVPQDAAMKAGALGLATGVVAWTARPGVAVLSVGHQRLFAGALCLLLAVLHGEQLGQDVIQAQVPVGGGGDHGGHRCVGRRQAGHHGPGNLGVCHILAGSTQLGLDLLGTGHILGQGLGGAHLQLAQLHA